MAAAIKCVIQSHVIDNVDGVPVGKITYATADAVDVPDDKWFVIEAVGDADRFVTVVSPADFDNLPIVRPDSANPLRFYRTNEATFVTDFPTELANHVVEVRRRFQATIDALKQLAESPEETTFEFE